MEGPILVLLYFFLRFLWRKFNEEYEIKIMKKKGYRCGKCRIWTQNQDRCHDCGSTDLLEE